MFHININNFHKFHNSYKLPLEIPLNKRFTMKPKPENVGKKAGKLF